MLSASRTHRAVGPTTPPTRQSRASQLRLLGLVVATLIGLLACFAGGVPASATVPAGHRTASRLTATHTVWHAGEATVTGPIAPGTQLRVHAVLNQACKIGAFTTATCRPQSLLGWEKITEDGTFAPVPAPAAPYGVCQGDTAVVIKGHPHVISMRLFACFTLRSP